jgi:LDH2 family malate/lactate/ureidoglycolate dehydrogenase
MEAAESESPQLFRPEELRRFAAELFAAVGMEAEKATVMAEVLVEADLLGHSTHGLALVPRYMDEIGSGAMAISGTPRLIADRGACVSWDGQRLPGPWLGAQALDLAMQRVGTYGTVMVAIGNSHHVGCLAAYLPRVTEHGYVALLASSGPGVATVAPFGGARAVLSPAPIAAGFPTRGDPILIDVSASITTNNMAATLAREGRRYPHRWLLDAAGEPTDDPAVLRQGGSILPAGGLDHGQKGYGWGLIAEALSQGLSGFGRADAPRGMLNTLTVQVIDPAAFAGADAFVRQTSAIAEMCRSSPPRSGQPAVRLPGESAMRRKRAAARDGVALNASIVASLQHCAERLKLSPPNLTLAGPRS